MVIELHDQPIMRERFASLYTRAMDEKKATQFWRFPREYLDAHYDELAARVFYASDSNGGARMLMVIGGYGTAYAHFLGWNGGSPRAGLDEALYCHAAKILKWDGYQRFHLEAEPRATTSIRCWRSKLDSRSGVSSCAVTLKSSTNMPIANWQNVRRTTRSSN